MVTEIEKDHRPLKRQDIIQTIPLLENRMDPHSSSTLPIWLQSQELLAQVRREK